MPLKPADSFLDFSNMLHAFPVQLSDLLRIMKLAIFYHPTRRDIMKMVVACLLALGAMGNSFPVYAHQVQFENRYSPLNKKRPLRPYTRYIVLHTTEGEEEGSLQKIVRFGEAHYCVSKSGKIWRIIDKAKIAKHAGRSMWEGRSPVDNYSIGIEVIGYHNRDINDAQYAALRELLRQLKSLYKISDKNVLVHSMVAYGRPNQFHQDNHRGRKRCGMIFAKPEVRARLGMKQKPERDSDVEAGRLKVADCELYGFLFAPQPRSTLIAAAGKPSALLKEEEDTQSFEGFLEIGKDGATPQSVAGTAYTSATTIYFFPDGLIRTGAELKKRRSTRKLLDNSPKGTQVLVGYIYGGHVKTHRPPASIAGVKWNYPSTYYRYPNGNMLSGDDVDVQDIPAGALIFYQK